MRLLPPQLINALRERPPLGRGTLAKFFRGGVRLRSKIRRHVRLWPYLLGFSNELFHWGIPRFENNNRCKNGYYFSPFWDPGRPPIGSPGSYLLGFSNELFHWGIPRFENNDRCKNGYYFSPFWDPAWPPMGSAGCLFPKALCGIFVPKTVGRELLFFCPSWIYI